MRNALLWGMLAVVLLVSNYLIVTKERILRHGDMVLVELAPRDPRSLLQGDYMALRYRINNKIASEVKEKSADGHIVVTLDENSVAQFQRIHRAQPALGSAERLLRFRKRGIVVRVASDAYFFQEGHAGFYQAARYGELRVDATGNAVLVGLRDVEFQSLQAIVVTQ